MQGHLDTLIDVIQALELMSADLLLEGHYKTSKYLDKVIRHLSNIAGIVDRFCKGD